MNNQSENTTGLNEQLDLWESYFSNTVIPQMYVDSKLFLRVFTPPAMTQFSLTENDTGKSINDLKNNFRFPGIADNIQQVMNTRKSLEKEIQTTDMRWYQMNILPFFRLKDKKFDGVIITFIEITNRIKDLQAQEKVVADIAILLDTISHDLRSPLANLEAAMHMFLSTSPQDTNQFTNLHTVALSAMGTLRQQISDLTESRKVEWTEAGEELLNFENILEDVLPNLKEGIRLANARITENIKISQFTASRRSLRSIVYNLLSNAIKFRSPERDLHIGISTFKEDNFFVISVRDNGVGIEENQIDKIFSKYHRLDDNIEGSGIGLYLVKEIVTHAGGKIEVESRVGEGTEFKVYLRQET